LNRPRSTEIRFSVPSSWACRSRKFWVAFSSGYFSTLTRRRPIALPSPSWAFWNCERRGVLDRVRVQLDLGRRRAGLDDLRERFLLEVGRALHRLHEVRDQVGPALIDVLDLGPASTDGLVGCVQPVVGPSRHAPDDENTDEDEDNAAQSDAFTHIRNRSSKNGRCYQETGDAPVKSR
jgi:hypothetical protein